jgi:tRNA-specific 2-thiouridylase
VVAMSGGVDSSATAALLKSQGHEVIGITMRLYQPDDPLEEANHTGGCCSLDEVNDARRVCEKMGIPHYAVNFKHEFNEKVVAYFEREYKRGRTPNPCIACNIYMKYDLLLQKALDLGADFLATGHYANVRWNESTGRYELLKAVDPNKDQSYVLYNMTQEQLKHTMFPLGGYHKPEVREIARSFGLTRVANKPDSQEICFIPNNDYKSFIRKRAASEIEDGHYYDTQGNVLGKHQGIPFYTIGQRKGLGITTGKPLFVVDIIPERNAVVLGNADEVFSDGLTADSLNWISIEGINGPMQVEVKIRSAAQPAKAWLTPDPDATDQVKVRFEQPQRAVTPGQAVVFYQSDVVIGGGVIAARDDFHSQRVREQLAVSHTE